MVGGPAEVVLGRGVGGSGRGLGSVLKDWSALIVTGCFFVPRLWRSIRHSGKAPQVMATKQNFL